MRSLISTLIAVIVIGLLVESRIKASTNVAGNSSRAVPKIISANAQITESNWRSHPKIVAIKKIVNSVNASLRQHTFKTAERRFDCGRGLQLRRIARNAKGAVAWYEDYGEGEDSSGDYHQYYDSEGRLRFALITVYAATGLHGSIEQHRVYFDETGKLIWQSRKRVKGPGYFAPPNLQELPQQDPAKEFANSPEEGCKELKPKPRLRA